MAKTKIVKKAETKPVCPFYWKKGVRCVLAPEVREYDKCGPVPCTVESVPDVHVSRPDDR
jgi:hypothetical protein